MTIETADTFHKGLIQFIQRINSSALVTISKDMMNDNTLVKTRLYVCFEGSAKSKGVNYQPITNKVGFSQKYVPGCVPYDVQAILTYQMFRDRCYDDIFDISCDGVMKLGDSILEDAMEALLIKEQWKTRAEAAEKDALHYKGQLAYANSKLATIQEELRKVDQNRYDLCTQAAIQRQDAQKELTKAVMVGVTYRNWMIAVIAFALTIITLLATTLIK